MASIVRQRTLATAAIALVAMVTSVASAFGQTATPRIIGGNNVAITEVPFQVRVTISQPPYVYQCGGSIRDATHVITAAHCVTTETRPHIKSAPAAVTVYYGSADTDTQTPASVSAVAVPSQYTASFNPDDSYDAAVLTPMTPLNLSGPNAKAIPLAAATQPKGSGSAFVSGWGLTNSASSTTPRTLKGVSVPLRPDSACEAEFGSAYERKRAVCAGGGSVSAKNPDTCNGDSGGPLAVDLAPGTATRYVLLGLTSFGDPQCGRQNTPAVYTYTQGVGIHAFLTASGSTAPGPGRTATQPSSSTPTRPRDRTKPSARVSKVRCKGRRCTIRFRASDPGGGRVKKLSVRLGRKVRSCRVVDFRIRCRTRTRTKRPRAKKIAGGYKVTVSLRPGRYSLAAVATDTSGNRSKVARKRFRVRRG